MKKIIITCFLLITFNTQTQDIVTYPEIPKEMWYLKNKEKAAIKLEQYAKEKLIEKKKNVNILIVDSTSASGINHANKLRVLLQNINLRLKIDEEEYINVWNKTYKEYQTTNNKDYDIIITSTRAEYLSEYLSIEEPYKDIKTVKMESLV